MRIPSRLEPTRAVAASLLVPALAVAASACNFIGIKRAGFEDTFRVAGLSYRTATLGDDTLTYWEGGQGPAVLLIHGYGLGAIWHFNAQVESLARYHRVVVPDLLWSGGSNSATGDFGMRHQARALVALLDSLRIAQADVMGLSYGGFIAWMIAARYPNRVNSLAMIGCPGATYTADDLNAMRMRFRVEHAADVFLPRTEEDVGRLLSLAWQDPPFVPRFARRQAVEQIYDKNRSEIRALMDGAMAELAEVERTPLPQAPTLLIWGDGDPIFPLELSSRVMRLLDGRVTLRVIPNSHHAANLEHPEQVNALLLEFFARQRQSDGRTKAAPP